MIWPPAANSIWFLSSDMAVCCILVAILMAQIAATLRRWGIFWGVVRPDPGEDADTLVRRMRQWLARPRVKAAVFAVVAIESVAVGSWTYIAHGSHLYRLGDEAIGRLTGHQVVYAKVCTPKGRNRDVRLVLGRGPGALPLATRAPLS